MDKQKFFAGLIIVLILVGLILFFRGGEEVKETTEQAPEIAVQDVEESLSSRLGISIPEEVERIALKDVRNEGASGLATRNFSQTGYDHTLLAALPELVSGTSYQAWLVRGEKGGEGYSVLTTGSLHQAKGGYLLQYHNDADLTDYQRVMVTVETVVDNQPETTVLEGAFISDAFGN